MARVVHVAVGVIVGDGGSILIAKRPDEAHQGGLWEFPGGKVEQGETLFEALKRELFEEPAIEILTTEPLIKIRHDYGDKIVLLDVHKVTAFVGDARGNEGQPIAWVAPEHLYQYDFPAANCPIIKAINLPSRLLITGDFADIEDFGVRLETALKRGIRLIQLRDKDITKTISLASYAQELCQRYSAKVLINCDPAVFKNISPIGQPGLHLNSKHLLSCNVRPVSENVLLGASCHDQFEIDHAQKIGVDFICLSPVLATQSHPGQPEMGWLQFEELVAAAKVPVFALGGMKESHLHNALQKGAQGIAAISEWW